MSRYRYVGIDPGLSGAIAILDDSGHAEVHDMPVGSDGRKRYVFAAGVVALLQERLDVAEHVYVYVERVHAMPKAGATSMFSFGEGYGKIQGVLAAMDLPYSLVEPTRWKRVMLADMGKSKDAARMRAMQLFPFLANRLSRKIDDGRAEALLIAEYGRRTIEAKP